MDVKIGGTADESDAMLVQAELQSLPEAVTDAISRAGIEIAVCRNNVLDFDPGPFGEPPENWPDDIEWDRVPGAYIPAIRTVLVATIGGLGESRRVPRMGEMHGSFSLAVHELLHGFDYAQETFSASPKFGQAWRDDHNVLRAEPNWDYFLDQEFGRRERVLSV